MAEQDYILASGAEKDRLRLQARVWEPATEVMLDQIGIRPGWSCVDLGCGTMGILGPLSHRVGKGGRVVGVDPDKLFLASAQEYVQEEGLGNVELMEGDVSHDDLIAESFNFVHERFVFPHVTSPEGILHDMIRLARPGGVICVQESDHSSWNFYPRSPKWPRLLEILEAGFALRSDINIGRRTYHMLRDAGLMDVKVHAQVFAFQDGHPYMGLPIIGANAMRQRLVQAGITTDAELDDLLADIQQRMADPATFVISFTVTQVWGRKPL